MQNPPTHSPGELSLAITSLSMGIGKLMDMLTTSEPALAALSYLVAIVAGVVTIYYKIKSHGNRDDDK